MKKLLACIAILLLLCAPALAEERVSIPLADGELSFVPFEGGYVLTRDTSASVFNRLGMSQREALAYMEEEGISVILLDQAFGCQTLLSVHENDYPSFTTFTEEERGQICDSFRDNYEQYGYQVHSVTMVDGNEFTFITAYITLTFSDGTVEKRIVYQTSYQGYDVLMTMFIFEADPADYILLADELMSSMRYTVDAGITTLGLPGVSLQLAVPEGMTVHTSAEEAGVTRAEPAAAEVVGCMADPDGTWYILWQLDESASGDMDRLSAAGVKSLYEARAKNRRFLGCTVTLTEDHPESRQRYIRMAYEFTDESGRTWYAEEYYTKQAGWGASVTLYSAEPLTEASQTMLETIVNSQMVAVDE